jgi:hypothetical protein
MTTETSVAAHEVWIASDLPPLPVFHLAVCRSCGWAGADHRLTRLEATVDALNHCAQTGGER